MVPCGEEQREREEDVDDEEDEDEEKLRPLLFFLDLFFSPPLDDNEEAVLAIDRLLFLIRLGGFLFAELDEDSKLLEEPDADDDDDDNVEGVRLRDFEAFLISSFLLLPSPLSDARLARIESAVPFLSR